MPLSAESDYILMSMHMFSEISGDMYHYTRFLHLDVDGMVDNGTDIGREVERSFMRWWESSQTPDLERGRVAYASFLEAEWVFAELADTMASDASERDGDPFSNLDQELSGADMQRWKSTTEGQHARLLEIIPKVRPEDIAAFEAERRARHMAEMRADYSRIAHGRPARQIEEAKKAMVRSADLLANVAGKEAVQTFLSGDHIVISGVSYDYRIRKSYIDVLSHTMSPDMHHVPYTLQVMSKSGELLANGCVYFESTPMLDQIVGLSLFARDVEGEIELLTQMNMFNHTEAFFADRMLVALKKARPREKARNAGVVEFMGIAFPEERDSAVMAELRCMAIQGMKSLLDIPKPHVEAMFSPPLKFDEMITLPPVVVHRRMQSCPLLQDPSRYDRTTIQVAPTESNRLRQATA